jgi:ABC-type uncharacterized transport system ATPase subunit
MKKWLAGRRLYSNKEVIVKIVYFAEVCQSYYSKGINKLEKRWTEHISLKEDYVKKIKEVSQKIKWFSFLH